ncbi:hypothetical protein AD428_23165, partial [Achromobacter sp. DMS1]
GILLSATGFVIGLAAAARQGRAAASARAARRVADRDAARRKEKALPHVAARPACYCCAKRQNG